MAGKGGNGVLVVGGLGLLALLAFASSGTAKAATVPAKSPAKPPVNPGGIPIQPGGGGGGPSAPVTVAGCQVDAGYPFGNQAKGALSQAALSDLLTNPALDSTTLGFQAAAQQSLGFPLVGACIQARANYQATNGPASGASVGGAPPVIAGCQVDANFPLSSQYILQDLLTNQNYTSTFLNQQAAQYASQYPLVSACLSAAAAGQAAMGN